MTGKPTRRQVAQGLITIGSSLAIRAARAQPAPIRIGVTSDLTGPSAGIARAQVNAAQLFADQVNAAGGLIGRKVELLVRDSQMKPDLGANHARQLLASDNVDFLLGPDSSAVAVAVSNVAKQYKKIVMMSTPNSPRLTMEFFHRYLFTVTPSGLMEARAIADVIGPKYKNFAFIGADFEAAHQGLKYFTDRLAVRNPNATIRTEQWPKLGETDYSPYITALLSSQPDVIYSYLFGADLIGFIKQATPYGLPAKAPIAGLTFVVDLVALGNDMPDGMVGLMRAPFFAVSTKAMDSFGASYRSRFNAYPDDNAALSYEGLLSICEAVRKTGTTETEAVVDALESISVPALTGDIKFRPLDHQADVPSFIGATTSSPQYPFKILRDVQIIRAEEVWPSPQEVTQARDKT